MDKRFFETHPQNCTKMSFAKLGLAQSNFNLLVVMSLIKNSVLFYKYLSLQKSNRNGYVFKICVWISVCRRKKQFENLILGCQDIKKKRSFIFFETPCMFQPLSRPRQLFRNSIVAILDFYPLCNASLNGAPF